ncbi:MAG: beta-lactamase domain protein [Acidimicrobiia bacterium]|nr:beta-lactamase domain protein [Acidimicrobiia bacterium]
MGAADAEVQMTHAPPALRIGDIEIWAVMDGRFTLAEPPNFVAHGGDHLPGDGKWLMDIGGFVVKAGDRLLLVDAGAGQGNNEVWKSDPFSTFDDAPPGLQAYIEHLGITDPTVVEEFVRSMALTDIRTGSFGDNLAKLGFQPTDFTDVLISHLHFDHVGWVSKAGQPFFPNAVVRCERHDADYFLAPGFDDSFYSVMWGAMPISQRMAPVLDRFEPWDEDTTIAPGIDCRYSPGHTPGSSIFAITSGRQQALILGDTVHCPQELVDPAFRLGSDLDEEQADRTRAAIRQEAGEDTYFSAPHFPNLKFGRILPGDRKLTWHVNS